MRLGRSPSSADPRPFFMNETVGKGKADMTSFDERLSALIGRLYDAAFDGRLWAGIAPEIARALESTSAVLKVYHGADVHVLESTENLQVSDARKDWAQYWHQHDLWVERTLTCEPCTIVTDREMITPEEQTKSAYYQEWLPEFDIFHAVGTIFPTPEGGYGVLGIHRPREAHHYTNADRRGVALLLPHLQRALQLSWRLSTVQQVASLETLERIDAGVLVVTQSCHVVYANALAEQMLCGKGITVAGGKVTLEDKTLHEELIQIIRTNITTAAGGLEQVGGVFAIPREDRLPLTLSVSPLRPTGILPFSVPLALILLRDPEHPPTSIEHLRILFGLTRQEAVIARDLGTGLSLEHIARKRGVGLGTVRSHLKQILSKTNTSRQAEAAVLFARCVPAPRESGHFSPK